jgi:hypothetical protein
VSVVPPVRVVLLPSHSPPLVVAPSHSPPPFVMIHTGVPCSSTL